MPVEFFEVLIPMDSAGFGLTDAGPPAVNANELTLDISAGPA